MTEKDFEYREKVFKRLIKVHFECSILSSICDNDNDSVDSNYYNNYYLEIFEEFM